jgi:hypothetical protein
MDVPVVLRALLPFTDAGCSTGTTAAQQILHQQWQDDH